MEEGGRDEASVKLGDQIAEYSSLLTLPTETKEKRGGAAE